jgi:hypothetical protein
MSALKRISIWIAIVIPPFSFYVLLARSINSFPIGQDDYGAVLNFLLQWKTESGIKHIVQILTFQHNEYRCIFANAIIGIQFAILGHTDLMALKILGDLFVIPLFGVLYLIWRDCGRPRDYTLVAFVPVSWILFQLQYEGTLNYTISGLQCVPVILFALLTCFLATKASNAAFLGATLSLLLCIASYGDGLFLIPVGGLIYLQRREFRRLVAWCCCSAVACLVYFLGYNFLTVEAVRAHSNNDILSILQHLSLVFALAFLGNIAAILNPVPAVLFGMVLLGVFIFATWDRLFSRHPALYYSALFFLVTAVAVSGLRSPKGLEWSLNSPYRINSTVLSILLYLYLADKAYAVRVRPLILKVGGCIFGVLLLGFNFASDRGGQKVLLLKKQRVEAGILRWERHEPGPPMIASTPDDLTAGRENGASFQPPEPILSESIREGIYKLPELPVGN